MKTHDIMFATSFGLIAAMIAPPAEAAQAQPPGQQAAPGYPTLVIAPPFRADDLKPKHYVYMGGAPTKWHDINISRRDGGWRGSQPGLSGETHAVSWDTPVYAGVDGEVMACWRSAPHDIAYIEVADVVPIGGNFVVIKTDDGHWVYYAHMQTNSIPLSVCPIADADGKLDDLTDLVCVPAGPKSKECVPSETYITPKLRRRVRAGQAIGRVGAHGNAAGPHLHMGAGDIGTGDRNVDQTIQTNYHIVFDHAWRTPLTGTAPPFAWSYTTSMELPNALVGDAQVIWPGWKHEATYSASYRMADYSGNGADDLLCHDTTTGEIRVDYAADGKLEGTNWTRAGGWCNSASQRLHNGDFNDDGRDDLLCHDIESGRLWIDFADAQSQFTGTEYTSPHTWCNADTQQLRVGDFDGDGADDLLCHNHATGDLRVDRSDGTATPFAATDVQPPKAWCAGHYERLHIGKFDANASDDLLCHDTRSGARAVDLAGTLASKLFTGADKTASKWCYEIGQRLFVGDVDGAGSDDLVCHDSDTGKIYVDSGTLGATNWTGAEDGWCTSAYQRLKIGDVNGDGKDDLVCYDQVSGQRWVDYSSAGKFEGIDWTSPAGDAWCGGAREGLH